jgi:hypothetical protein
MKGKNSPWNDGRNQTTQQIAPFCTQMLIFSCGLPQGTRLILRHEWQPKDVSVSVGSRFFDLMRVIHEVKKRYAQALFPT